MVQKFLVAADIPVLYVQHRDCIENPENEAARINRFLSGTLTAAAMVSAVSGDLYRHRKQRHGCAVVSNANGCGRKAQ